MTNLEDLLAPQSEWDAIRPSLLYLSADQLQTSIDAIEDYISTLRIEIELRKRVLAKKLSDP